MAFIAARDPAVDIALYVGLIAAASVLLGLVWLWLRKRFSDDGRDASLGAGFTLHELARLHEEGHLTDEQYERARSRIAQVGSSSTAESGEASTLSPNRPAATDARTRADPTSENESENVPENEPDPLPEPDPDLDPDADAPPSDNGSDRPSA